MGPRARDGAVALWRRAVGGPDEEEQQEQQEQEEEEEEERVGALPEAKVRPE